MDAILVGGWISVEKIHASIAVKVADGDEIEPFVWTSHKRTVVTDARTTEQPETLGPGVRIPPDQVALTVAIEVVLRAVFARIGDVVVVRVRNQTVAQFAEVWDFVEVAVGTLPRPRRDDARVARWALEIAHERRSAKREFRVTIWHETKPQILIDEDGFDVLVGRAVCTT